MALDKKISELNPVTVPFIGDELLAVVQNGETRKTTLGDMSTTNEIIKDIYANVSTAKAVGTLVEGAMYVISEVGTKGDQTVVLKALSPTELSLHGSLIARNADYQDGGNYAGVLGGGPVTRLGLWHNTLTIDYNTLVPGPSGPFKLGEVINNTTVGQTGTGVLIGDDGVKIEIAIARGTFAATNDLVGVSSGSTAKVGVNIISELNPAIDNVVIYNNLHWKNLTGANGVDSPDSAGSPDWELIPKSTVNGGYITEVDFIEFDFDPNVGTNGWIQRRTDRRANDVYYSKLVDDEFGAVGFSALDLFRWGSDTCVGNVCNESFIDNRNDLGAYSGNNIERAGRISGNICKATASIVANRMEGVVSLIDNNILLDNTQIARNVMDADTSIIGNVLSGANTEIDKNTLLAEAAIDANLLETNARLEESTIGQRAKFTNKTLKTGVVIDRCHFGVDFLQVEDIDTSLSFKRCEQGFSNFVGKLDLDIASATATTINLAHVDHKLLEIAGIIVMTTADPKPVAKKVDAILNMDEKFPVEFRAEEQLVVTMVHEPVTSVVPNKITIEGGANFDIVGRTNASDCLQLRTDGTIIRQISASKLI